MNNLVVRSISGLIFVAVMVTSIYFSSFYFAIVFSLLTVVGLFEFYRLFDKMSSVSLSKWLAVLGGLCIYFPAITLCMKTQIRPIYFGIYPCYLMFLFISELYRKKENPVLNIAVSILGHFYIAIPFALITFIEYQEVYFSTKIVSLNIMVLAFFVMIWASDTGAYLVGMCIGKHKMFERISPKKTWEGFFGGFLFSLLVGFLFYYKIQSCWSLDVSLFGWLLMAVLVFIFGVYGDLVESMFKRYFGVKDSGNILPGHGGLLDRFDSALLASPVLFLISMLYMYGFI